ncbi:MAG: PEP-CTERM sorting domain-containing protein [Rhizobacter sp.]|nr:PEP-CTERM sorting domain-containing protein [Rhizobacter sp.]
MARAGRRNPRHAHFALKSVPAVVALLCAGTQTPAQALELARFDAPSDWDIAMNWHAPGAQWRAADRAFIDARNAQLSFAAAIAALNPSVGRVGAQRLRASAWGYDAKPVPSADAMMLTWFGGTGDWSVGANWSPAGGPPGADDTAIINAGNAQLGADTAIAGLDMGGGQLSGSGKLTVSGASQWTGGAHNGVGTSQFDGSLAISGANDKNLGGGRVLNVGDTTWSGNTATNNNRIRFTGATINSSGTWTDSNAFDAYVYDYSGTNAFNNNGTYDKQGNTLTTMNVAYNNVGTTNVNAGRMRFTGGGTSASAFNVASGAVLDFNYGTYNLNAASITGAGTTEISGSSGYSFVNLNGGTVNTAMLLSGGNLQGADHTLLGPVTWTGSVIQGAASTTVAGDMTISGANDKNLSGGRVLNTEGTTAWSGNTATNNNRIRFTGATINNSGTWNDSNNFDAYTYDYSGTNAFNNTGTYNKQGNTTTTMGVVYNNTGATNVEAGTLTVISAFTNHGLVQTAAGATFLGSNATFVNAGILAGDGTIATHANGDIVNQGGAIDPGINGIGHLSITGALVNSATGKLNFELASLASFDTLAVSDDVSLGGEIGVWNFGYTPVLGDSFVVMTFAAQADANPFDSIGVYGFAPGTEFTATYHLHDVTLTVSAVAAVPEPQTVLLMLAGLGVLGFVARRRLD